MRILLAAIALAGASTLGGATSAEAVSPSKPIPACTFFDGYGQRVCVWDGRHTQLLGHPNYRRSFILTNTYDRAGNLIHVDRTYITHRQAHAISR